MLQHKKFFPVENKLDEGIYCLFKLIIQYRFFLNIPTFEEDFKNYKILNLSFQRTFIMEII